MAESCPLFEGETYDESQLLFAGPYCASVCIARMMQRTTPITTSDPNCSHDLLPGNGFLKHLGGRQRFYEDQSVCVESGEVVLVEEYAFKCIEN